MLLIEDYVGPHSKSPDWTPTRIDNAVQLLQRVNALVATLKQQGVTFKANPNTGTLVSGKTYGGFRPQNCPQGAPNSSHKTGSGIDLYDPKNEIDAAITDALLEEFHLYREHPDATKSWVHLTTRAPGSGRRSFLP